MKQLFDKVSQDCSRTVSTTYSTSFSLSIRCLGPSIRQDVHNIYGFVRVADEIVDTFHDFDKKALLTEFKKDTYKAIEEGISLNPVLNSLQYTVNKYDIDLELIETFFQSMEMDLEDIDYSQKAYETYILGSAEVVGLMCLKIFCNGDQQEYDRLKHPAMRLGSAFQKINFLRDLKADVEDLGRTYFPDIDARKLNESTKKRIEEDIAKDFQDGFKGILELPKSAKFGVYLAYLYYYKLFQKIKSTQASTLLQERIRIPNSRKLGLLTTVFLRHKLNLL